MTMRCGVLFLLSIFSLPLVAQNGGGFIWMDPTGAGFQVVEGHAQTHGLERPFDRIPKEMEKEVRDVVWRKSREATGLLIRFRTDAPEIQVRYNVDGVHAFEHMPATGVSGLDLYAVDGYGGWNWTGGEYRFGDTIHYRYPNLDATSRVYQLYLPLYNNVEGLSIGVPSGVSFEFLPARTQKRVVVYGTSIAQGGCASRPGMAWTAQLGRMLDIPLVNLGFSSNGMLEKPLLELMARNPAEVFILDCLPNLITLANPEIRHRLRYAVSFLQEKRPDVPIVMAEHADAGIGLLDTGLQKRFEEVNALMREVFAELEAAGRKGIYLLSAAAVGLDNECTVDGQHPNDIGMQRYANAYASLIRKVMMEKNYPQLPQEGISVSTWLGFNRADFEYSGRRCTFVAPKNAAPGRPWIWRTEFFGHEPQADSALVAKGFHLVYMDLTDMYGAPVALDLMDAYYRLLVDRLGLSKQAVLEGFSRGGLFALNWAARRPEQVASIYLDAPVCDFRSWPGKWGDGPGSEADWQKLKEVYGFKNDREALRFRMNPVDHLKPLAEHRIPILSVCGDADRIVPMYENTYLVQKRYEELGGVMQVIAKPGVGHHPHSLEDPAPIVDFVLANLPDPSGSEPVVNIGSRLELFIDNFLIDSLKGSARRRMHHPQPKELVIVHDEPWEGPGSGYHSVFSDDEGYKMYYKAWNRPQGPGSEQPQEAFYLGYASSKDGVNWEKPSLGLVDYAGSANNNIVLGQRKIGGVFPDPGHPAVFLDQNPNATADAKYKAIIRDWSAASGLKGLLAFKSPDGIRWTLMADHPVITNGAFDSQNLAFWDPVRKEYRAYWRFMTADGVRSIRTATSDDFITWKGERDVSMVDPVPGEEFYTNQIKPYSRAPHIFIGFPVRYLNHGWSPTMHDLPDLAHRKWRAETEERLGTALTESLLISSRDGVHFDRWNEAFLRPGRERPGTWSYGQQYIAWQIVETKSALEGAPPELSLYASEQYWTGQAGSALRRYTLRMDGFVSVNAPMSGGELVTRAVYMAGSRLVLNCATSAAGEIRVEIQDSTGNALPGFGLDDCFPLFGDSLEKTVSWKQGADLSHLQNKPIKLRFVLRDADLYSLKFK